MKTREFMRDSPLGLGWAMGFVSTEDAVKALADSTGRSELQVVEMYSIAT